MVNNVIPKLNKYWIVDSVRTFDGKTIRFGVYQKGQQPVRRAVVFANGRSEWLEKYDFLPELLQLPEDCVFVTWDHRGQGASDGIRAGIDHYDTFVRDMQAIFQAAIPNTPYALLAHSMGGLISLYGTLTGKLHPKTLALSAPLLLMPETIMKRRLASRVAKVMNRGPLRNLNVGHGNFEKSRFAKNPLTHSAENYLKLQNAPYKVPSPTFGWVNATFEATAAIFDEERVRKLSAPVLIMGGSEEIVVDPRGFSLWTQLAHRVAATPARYELIPGARHELFNEIPQYQQRAVELTRRWFADFLGG